MAEYIIDEQAYYKALHAAFSAGIKGHAGYATDCLTDELVRCKDCRSARIAYTKTGKLKTASCSWHGRRIRVDGYCAWGVRREDE